LYRAAAAGLLTHPGRLGYEGAGIGIRIPVRYSPDGRDLDINTRTDNTFQRSLRCLGERGFALLTGRWRTLHHVTASPGKTGDIVVAMTGLLGFRAMEHCDALVKLGTDWLTRC
jgi:hypothetical protein